MDSGLYAMQYLPNAPPGYTGTTLYFYGRIVDICIGELPFLTN